MSHPTGKRGGESFERFYLRQVAISEGCGCAELVIRRETERPRGARRDPRDGARAAPGWRGLLAGLRNRLPRKRSVESKA